MAITKVYTFTNDDGVQYTDVADWLAAYNPPQIGEGFAVDAPVGITWLYALASATSVTRTMTFADQATFDAWNGDGVTPVGTPFTFNNVTKAAPAE